jgi:hypothetical protein
MSSEGSSPIPLQFVLSGAPVSGTGTRPEVSFDSHSIPQGGTLTVTAQSKGGWVFCGVLEHGCGEYLLVEGATVTYLEGFSGDEVTVKFLLQHDGESSSVKVTYNTRPD